MKAPLSLKGRALRLLATREHSRAELERKLAAHEQQEGQLRAVLDELQAKGFINEQRVADSVVYRRGARLGAARVIHELRAKGLDDQVVAQAAAILEDTELERALEVWRKKFGKTASDPAGHVRQIRFMTGRGFSPALVNRLLRAQAAGRE